MKLLFSVLLTNVGQLISTYIIHSFSKGSYVVKKKIYIAKAKTRGKSINCDEEMVHVKQM